MTKLETMVWLDQQESRAQEAIALVFRKFPLLYASVMKRISGSIARMGAVKVLASGLTWGPSWPSVSEFAMVYQRRKSSNS